MLALQAAAGSSASWPRAAIHDTVAAIARQPAYRRDVGSTLFDRIMQWIGEAYTRLVEALAGVPHGRLVATVAVCTVGALIVARIAYAARLRGTAVDMPNEIRARGTSATDPWRDAEQLAAEGRFTEAAHALYRAAVVVLASHGLVLLHESKTSGDYARELRRRGSPVHASFRRFGQRYGRIIYGTGECSATDYAALLEDARTLAPAAERAA